MHRISLVMILIVVFTFSACQTATNHMLKSKNENSQFFLKNAKMPLKSRYKSMT